MNERDGTNVNFCVFFFSGCLTGIAPHLPELIPFLINSLSEKRVSFLDLNGLDLTSVNQAGKKVEFQLALWTSSSQILLALGKSYM